MGLPGKGGRGVKTNTDIFPHCDLLNVFGISARPGSTGVPLVDYVDSTIHFMNVNFVILVPTELLEISK